MDPTAILEIAAKGLSIVNTLIGRHNAPDMINEAQSQDIARQIKHITDLVDQVHSKDPKVQKAAYEELQKLCAD